VLEQLHLVRVVDRDDTEEEASDPFAVHGPCKADRKKMKSRLPKTPTLATARSPRRAWVMSLAPLLRLVSS